MATYPDNIKTFTTKQDGVEDVLADHINQLQDEITAIEAELGVKPKGTKDNVVSRLNDVDTSLSQKETPAGAQAKVDALAGEGNAKTVKEIDDAFIAHKAENMPHQIKDTTNDKEYRYGLQIKDGVTQLIYEEVV